jgi:hypothetical protein
MWKAIASILVLASSSLALRADNPSPAISMNREQVQAEIERRKNLFEAEMATGAVPDWAGEYSNGIEFGRNSRIKLAPHAGFTHSRGSACGRTYDANFGAVVVRGNRLSLRYELPNDEAHFGGSREFVIVRWGQRIYLLPEEELGPFVNAVNSGKEPHKHCIPSCAPFLVRRGDDEKPVSGTPDLPAEYRRRLLDRPITGRVVRVLDDESEFDLERGYGWRTIRVEIDLGSDDGVWEGMELYASANPDVGGGFKVEQTQARSSVAINREVTGPEAHALEPGFCLSTRPDKQACPNEQTAALR